MKETSEELTKKYQEPLYIEGIGTFKETGTLDLEKLIKRLLKTKYVTPTIQKTIYIKGIGSITSVGEINLEESITSLLKNKYIIG